MGTTSEKLTYLNNTKQLLKENINNLGGNLTTEPFRQYASVLEDIYERIPKVSGIGTSLSLSPTMAGKIKLNEIQGDTLQDETPTPDTPVEMQSVTGLQNINVCGKNLFDKSTITTGQYIDASGNLVNDNSNFVGDYIPINNTKSYYVSQSAGEVIRVGYYDSNKTFISRQLISANYGSLTIPNNAVYVRLSCYNQSSDTLQLELGTQQTSYEPYKGNTYEVNLGKNLLNIPNGTYSKNGLDISVSNQKLTIDGTTSANTSINITSGFKISTPGTYTVSATPDLSSYGSNLQIGAYVYYANGSYKTNIDIRNANKTQTISNGEYIGNFWVYVPNGNTIDNLEVNVQLEKGSQATSYSPYFTPIELNKIGDYQDKIYKDNGKWYVEKQIGKVVLDGNTNKVYNYNAHSGTTYITANYNNSNVKKLSIPEISNVSDKLIGTVISNTWSGNILNSVSQPTNGNYIQICLPYSIASDLTELNSWLLSNNIKILYVLATPTYTEITNTELISQLESIKSKDGTTNISITSEDLEMILNVSALKGDVE